MIDLEPFYADAFAQYEAGQMQTAIESFRFLCYKHPLEGRFWFGLAASLQENKEYETALEAWAVTSVLKQEDPYPHFHAAECYFSLLNIQDALIALDKASERVKEDVNLEEKIALLRKQWERTA